jgi:hypothetical protein
MVPKNDLNRFGNASSIFLSGFNSIWAFFENIKCILHFFGCLNLPNNVDADSGWVPQYLDERSLGYGNLALLPGDRLYGMYCPIQPFGSKLAHQ